MYNPYENNNQGNRGFDNNHDDNQSNTNQFDQNQQSNWHDNTTANQEDTTCGSVGINDMGTDSGSQDYQTNNTYPANEFAGDQFYANQSTPYQNGNDNRNQQSQAASSQPNSTSSYPYGEPNTQWNAGNFAADSTNQAQESGQNNHPSYFENQDYMGGTAYNSYPMMDVANPEESSGGAAAVPKKQGMTRNKAMALIVAGMLLAGAFGFGGSLLAQQLTGNSAGGKPIIQSVVNTSAKSGGNGDTATSVVDVANTAANSVVEITTETVSNNNWIQQYVTEGAGSGVIITKDGYIVTNNHVISGASKITVRLNDGNTYEAKLIGTDSKTDIAVIKIEATDLQAAVMGDSSKLQVGELAIAIGNPLGELGGTVTDGIISALDRQITIQGETMTLLQTSAAINPGNSGGGLFNGSGELIGVVNAKSSGSDIEGLGFAIPINTAKTVIEDLMSNGYVSGRVALGVSLADITDAQTAMQYGVSELGIYVAKVENNSDAYRAGVKAGDRILRIDNTAVANSSDVKMLLERHSVGDKMEMVVKRDNQEVTLTVTLTEYSPSDNSNSFPQNNNAGNNNGNNPGQTNPGWRQ